MQILLDSSSNIIGYATVGGFENGIAIDESLVPSDFFDDFWERKYKYENESIILTGIDKPTDPDSIPAPDYDTAFVELANLLDEALTKIEHLESIIAAQ